MGNTALKVHNWIWSCECPLSPPTIERLLGTFIKSARLKVLRRSVPGHVRIALHGTNSFSADLMQKCIACGVSKVNVNKLVLDDYLQHLSANAASQQLTSLMEGGVQKVASLTAAWMKICGSAGKA